MDNKPPAPSPHLRLYPKQALAWEYLTDQQTTRIVYGGAAGGAKTFLGCAWQIHNRLNYPGTRGLIGRAQLKRLRQTTLRTFFDVCQHLGLQAKFHFTYAASEGLIRFANGSEIWLRDLAHQPSDPDFTSLGSLEITDAFVDEAGELSHKAVQVLASRIRYRLDVAGLPPKLLMTCNPARGWLYTHYYKPSTEGKLPQDAMFIQALLADNQNPAFVAQYRKQLQQLDPVTRQRLLAGDWDYADDELALFHQPQLVACTHDPAGPMPSTNSTNDWFLSVDVARFGKDSTAVGLWQGLHLMQIWLWQKQDLQASAQKVKQLMQQYRIAPAHVVVDTDGVGGGLADQLPGCRQFVAMHKPVALKGQPQAYENLKTQCYYLLAQVVEEGRLSLSPSLQQQYHEGKSLHTLLLEELLVIRRGASQNDGKLSINRKDAHKALLGRSPDLADMVMMRMVFLLKAGKLLFS